MGVFFASILGALASGVSALFTFKSRQADVVTELIRLGEQLSSDNAKLAMSQAAIIVAESTAGGITSRWRPMLMLIFAAMIISSWFGYVPPHMDDPMSPMMTRIFDLMELGISGYIGGRSLEKIFSTIGTNKTIRSFIEKKLL